MGSGPSEMFVDMRDIAFYNQISSRFPHDKLWKVSFRIDFADCLFVKIEFYKVGIFHVLRKVHNQCIEDF